ncbi:hypothetical protein GGR51DRAFT_558310 [Nemania sp. FL0031]|nr:hypothetical protein GGR51DRAFT_558310 [Nemania sp. FL0031]
MKQQDVSGDNSTSSERKGKGKEKEEGNERQHFDTPPLVMPAESDSSNTNDSGQFTLSRLTASAASLMGGSIHGRVPNILPSSKAESSGTTQRPETETARLTHVSSPSVQSPLGGTFKSATRRDQGNSGGSDFSTFLATAKDTRFEPGESDPNQRITLPHLSHAAAAAMNDGSEVVDLLEAGPIVEEDDDRSHMTDKELLALRTALFGERLSKGTDWDDALNFVPDFISNHSMSNGEGYQRLAEHLGVSNVAEARDIWFSQWDNILSSYTDEVWGDLNPLVMAARQEIRSLSTSPEGSTTGGLNAVRRLQQILAHVRGLL